jgi:peptidoglycan/LPS O-acetylase OafA/YrhL
MTVAERTSAFARFLSKEKTIGTRMVATGGRTSGFDYIRIVLASCVVLAHSKAITFGITPHIVTAANGAILHPPFRQPFLWMILPSFFALSGFLVAGSLTRSRTTIEFVMLRVLRIVPALFVETVLAAFLLGPIVTTYTLRAYFSGSEFWHYPLNIIGDIHYYLPGVFTHNPWPRTVNGQLWTIPAELLCYLSLILISVVGLRKSKAAVLTVTVGGILFSLALMAFPGFGPFLWSQGHSNVGISTLLLCFLSGVTLYSFRDSIPLNFPLFALSAVLSYALLWNGDLQYLATLPIAYATVYIGLTDFRKTFVTATGDYSYGVYLYGFPVQQALAFALPQLHSYVLNFLISLAIALLLAAVSWHFVESRVLANRKTIIAFVQDGFDWLLTTRERLAVRRGQ